MNPILRWGKFNLVGAMGMIVQLAALALFNRLMTGHSLCATAAAVEVTLIHNFLWHRRYTWRDRCDEASSLPAFVRFQLTNGMVSLLGNLALMRLLIHLPHLPLLAANLVAILCCSIANFALGNYWAFASADSEEYIL
jgi:putative flippase GtrA